MSETAAEVLKAFHALEAMKEASIEKLLAERDVIDDALAALGYDHGAPAKKPRKTVTDESRKRMSAAQKARHSQKGGNEQNTEQPT